MCSHVNVLLFTLLLLLLTYYLFIWLFLLLLLLLLLQLPLLAPRGACSQEGPARLQLRAAAVPRRQKGEQLLTCPSPTTPSHVSDAQVILVHRCRAVACCAGDSGRAQIHKHSTCAHTMTAAANACAAYAPAVLLCSFAAQLIKARHPAGVLFWLLT
jgi:hypothetical protein